VRDVAIILGGQVDVAAGDAAAYRFGDLLQKRLFRLMLDLVDRVETQSVEAVFLQPEERILDEEVAHRALLIGDRRSPGCLSLGMKELRRVEAEIVPVRSEMVVDDVEEQHESALVGLVDEPLQPLRSAIDAVRRVEEHAVIAPAAPAAELRDGE
jgi:hypothetical protein